MINEKELNELLIKLVGSLDKKQVSQFLLSKGKSPYVNHLGELNEKLTDEERDWIVKNFIQEKPSPQVILPITHYQGEQKNLLMLIETEMTRLTKLKDALGLQKVQALTDLYARVATNFQSDIANVVEEWKKSSLPSNDLYLTNLGFMKKNHQMGTSLFCQSSTCEPFLEELHRAVGLKNK